MKEDILEITDVIKIMRDKDVIKIMRDKGELTPAYDYYKPTLNVNVDLHEAIKEKEVQVCDLKMKLHEFELDYDVRSAELTLHTDWKEQNISNAEGRKAYIILQLEGLKRKIIRWKNKLLRVEYELKALYRELDYFRECE